MHAAPAAAQVVAGWVLVLLLLLRSCQALTCKRCSIKVS
jgi:hypothetical protein